MNFWANLNLGGDALSGVVAEKSNGLGDIVPKTLTSQKFALRQAIAEHHQRLLTGWLTDKNLGLGAETAPLQGIGTM
ncbi:MAG: hypothetical protein AB4042_09500 [Leptolyngbyaceae cyanobacterium]